MLIILGLILISLIVIVGGDRGVVYRHRPDRTDPRRDRLDSKTASQ